MGGSIGRLTSRKEQQADADKVYDNDTFNEMMDNDLDKAYVYSLGALE